MQWRICGGDSLDQCRSSNTTDVPPITSSRLTDVATKPNEYQQGVGPKWQLPWLFVPFLFTSMRR